MRHSAHKFSWHTVTHQSNQMHRSRAQTSPFSYRLHSSHTGRLVKSTVSGRKSVRFCTLHPLATPHITSNCRATFGYPQWLDQVRIITLLHNRIKDAHPSLTSLVQPG